MTSPSTILQHSECVEASTVAVLQSTCGVAAQRREDKPVAEEFVLAVISLVGQVDWTVFLTLPGASAAAIASKFAGMEIDPGSADLADAIGELANILAGDVKARLDVLGIKADISLPSVMRGQNLEMMIPRDTPVQRTRFETPLGEIISGVIASRKAAA